MIPEQLWDAIKWMLIISTIGGWFLYIIEFLFSDKKPKKEKSEEQQP